MSVNARSHCPLTPFSREPREYPHETYITRIVIRLHLRNVRSKPSKVVDSGTNRKGVCDFLLVINSNFGPNLHRF